MGRSTLSATSGQAAGPLRLARRQDPYTQLIGAVMVAPAAFLMSLVVIAPFVYVLWESLFEKRTGAIGLGNFRFLLGPGFLPSLIATLEIGIGSVILEVAAAVPLALLLNQPLRGRGVMRSLVTLPWALPTIAVATSFLWLANTNYGLFDQLAMATGLLKEPIAFLGDLTWALPAVTVAHAWKGLPLVFIIILSALQSLPPEQLEAARVDGAGSWSQFLYVIVPHLKWSIALAGVLSGIYNFSLFDITFLLTGGGPSATTLTLPLLLYNQAFRALDFGRAAAVGIVIFLSGLLSLGLLFAAQNRERRQRA
jgi:multiple sugar transport system permease protein